MTQREDPIKAEWVKRSNPHKHSYCESESKNGVHGAGGSQK